MQFSADNSRGDIAVFVDKQTRRRDPGGSVPVISRVLDALSDRLLVKSQRLLKRFCVLDGRAKISDAELKRRLVYTDKREGLSCRMSHYIRHLVSMPQNNNDELMHRC